MTAGFADHSDGELALLCRAGDRQAFGEIVRRYKQPLHRTVSRLTGDEDEAVDIVQDPHVLG